MFKRFGKYITEKITGNLIGKAAKYGFWTTLCFFGPGPMIATMGVPVLTAVAITTHSGIIEYGTGKFIGKLL